MFVPIKSINKDGAEIEFVIITKPEVNVKKYTGLKVKREKIEVTKEIWLLNLIEK